MTSDYFTNPLAFDEQIIAEKLGIYDYSPTQENDVNLNLKVALLQEELNNSKQQLAYFKKRESFTPNKHYCSKCKKHDDTASQEEDDTKKLMMFLIIILFVFCVVQYFSYKSEAKEMIEMMYIIMQGHNNKHMQGAVQQGQPVPPVTPTQPVQQGQPVPPV
jgi:hypothetical protein